MKIMTEGASTMTSTPSLSSLPQILSYGGGLDSWAMLLEAVRRDDKPEVVAFCDVTDKDRIDPGEWPGTYSHIEQVVIPFCRKHGIRFEWIDTERYPVREARSLFAWMAARNQVPVAGNTRICTRIAKVERFEAWLDDTYGDQQVCVWIGFEAGEEKRADKDPNAGKPSAQRRNRFPLIEWGLCRCGCEEVARASGLPIPRKSACMFCPYASRCDWQNFAREISEQFARVVKLEADKPLTRNGEKIAIMGFGKKRKDGTRNVQLLDEWVTKPGRPRPPKVCDHCGQIRATKETRSDWLEDGDAEVLQALRDDRSEATEDPRAETDLANDVTAKQLFDTTVLAIAEATRFGMDEAVDFRTVNTLVLNTLNAAVKARNSRKYLERRIGFAHRNQRTGYCGKRAPLTVLVAKGQWALTDAGMAHARAMINGTVAWPHTRRTL